MNVFKSWLLATILIFGSTIISNAQKPHSPSGTNGHKYLVTTQQKELTGTYEQRKLYRAFLTKAVEECPYISDFHIVESKDYSDNHKVTWAYEVDGWADITRFYNWISREVSKVHNDVLKLSLTPYGHNYSIGGKIAMTKREDGLIASHKKSTEEDDGS